MCRWQAIFHSPYAGLHRRDNWSCCASCFGERRHWPSLAKWYLFHSFVHQFTLYLFQVSCRHPWYCCCSNHYNSNHPRGTTVDMIRPSQRCFTEWQTSNRWGAASQTFVSHIHQQCCTSYYKATYYIFPGTECSLQEFKAPQMMHSLSSPALHSRREHPQSWRCS